MWNGVGGICQKLGLPPLIGMLAAGILLEPDVWNLLDGSLLGISAPLRQAALVVILLRAGLNLDWQGLKKVGRPAVLMCFFPALCEIAGICIAGVLWLDISILDAAILGSVLAAVSPAVVIPKMLRLSEEGYGVQQGIPQLILAGASVDDITVIVLFTAFGGLASQGEFTLSQLSRIPTSVGLGVIGGLVCGWLMSQLFRRIRMRDSRKVLVLLSAAFLLVTAESLCQGPVGFSGLLAVMGMGIALQKILPAAAGRISSKYAKLWIFAELLLFVLVGAGVDLSYVFRIGWSVIWVLCVGLLFRSAGVWICLTRTPLTRKERLFCVIAYLPKATVQAAMGSVPLAMGLECGELVLTVAAAAILITAPLGALGMEWTYRRLLRPESRDTAAVS